MRAFEPEGELGTDPDSLPRFVEQAVRHVTVADNRETPVVESVSSGRISAHSFRPSQAIGSTCSLVPVVIAVSVGGRAGRWLSGWRSTGLARAVPVRARKGRGRCG